MRDFFITSLERLIGVVIVIVAVMVVIGAFVGASQASSGGQGILIFLLTLVGGGLYLILLGGFTYLGLGIYHNTRRTAEALERGRP